jgi:hypothetical protein
MDKVSQQFLNTLFQKPRIKFKFLNVEVGRWGTLQGPYKENRCVSTKVYFYEGKAGAHVGGGGSFVCNLNSNLLPPRYSSNQGKGTCSYFVLIFRVKLGTMAFSI